MISKSDFLEFKTSEGNVSYVRRASIAAIYHDGRATRILLNGVSGAASRSENELISSEMPEKLMQRLIVSRPNLGE